MVRVVGGFVCLDVLSYAWRFDRCKACQILNLSNGEDLGFLFVFSAAILSVQFL